MSGTAYPTLSMTISLYNILIDHIKDTVNFLDIDPIIIDASKKCKEKLLEYYNKTNETYLIATILDPRLKLQYYKENGWEDDAVNDIYKR